MLGAIREGTLRGRQEAAEKDNRARGHEEKNVRTQSANDEREEDEGFVEGEWQGVRRRRGRD